MQHFTYSKGIVYCPTMLSAITATATSVPQLVVGARSVMFSLTAATITTRSTVLTITISNDNGVTYFPYSMLIENSANATANGLTRVASITRAATGSDIFWMTPETLGGITHIKATATITDTGTPAGTITVKANICY